MLSINNTAAQTFLYIVLIHIFVIEWLIFGIMIKKNILGLLFLLSALCLFNSCEDDPYYDDYGWATDALCNNTWVDFYTNNKGYECEQRLDFYNDHTGEDFTIIYYPNGMTDELKTSFYWDWKDKYFDSFYVEYANGTDYYEDVRIGNEYLKCFTYIIIYFHYKYTF